MGKRKRKKSSAPLLWKATKGSLHLLTQGLIKSFPLLVFGAIGFGIFWGIREELYADSGFRVQSIRIMPENVLSQEKLQELQRLYVHRNLFKISPRKVAAVVKQDPKIREARVVRDFPNILRIEVRDRIPFAQVQLSPKGEYYLLSEDGVVLGRETTRNKNLLLIEVFESASVKPDWGSKLAVPGFEQAAELVKEFPKHRISHAETIDWVRLDHLGNVALVLTQGPELRFGREPMKKLRTLDSLGPLLRSPERDRIIYVELQYQDLIVKKKEGKNAKAER